MPQESYERSTSSGRGQRGSLRQLGDGRWEARYREDGRQGRRPQKTFPPNQKRQAQKWLRDRLADVDAARQGETAALVRRREAGLTVEAMIDRYLAAHEADPVTTAKLRTQLRQAKRRFAGRLASSIETYEISAWRKTLPPGSAHYIVRATKQVYAQALEWDWLDRNPCDGVRNPRPDRREVEVPPWDSILSIADEIDVRYEAAPILLAGAGLRLEEFLALEKRDLDLAGRMLHVRRVFSSGRLLELGPDGSKSKRQRRNVPLRQIVVDALEAMRPRIDTKILFAAPEGGYLRSENLRTRFWEPAVTAAGVAYFPPKNLRHVYASEALDAGMPTLTLSRRMGTSLKEIDETYGHLVPDAAEVELRMLDAYDEKRAKAR